MRTPFSKELSQIADSMGIAMYQRFSPAEAALFLRCPIEKLQELTERRKLAYIALPGVEVEYFGHQLLEYLLGRVVKSSQAEGKTKGSVKIIRSQEIQDITGLSRTTLWRLERKGEFPSRVALGPGSVGWRLDEVQTWVKTRKNV